MTDAPRPLRPYLGALSPLQAASAMQAARLTALELLDTAEVLWGLKRFAHATVFATLAIEEAGKLPILLMLFLGFGDRAHLWRSFRSHRAKTTGLNLGIESRIKVHYPEIPPEVAHAIGSDGPTPDELERNKQLALYSDCTVGGESGFACHLPVDRDWRASAWSRLCEAQAVIQPLRDYPPEELEVWLKHATTVQAQGLTYKDMLEPLHAELMARGFLKEGQWAVLLQSLRDAEGESDGA